ncbi:MAG: NAD(P)H-dependent oxidoreductase, partial [Alphaproteobacteria bacterium]|nr:NAD(P)H-dependent oxidoreductase [Alphaproteobacteria bacterium]
MGQGREACDGGIHFHISNVVEICDRGKTLSFLNAAGAPLTDFPALESAYLATPDQVRLEPTPLGHAPRILLLYGSLRERSFSRLLVEEASRILQALGAETKIFDPRDLPLPDSVDDSHPKVQELRDLSLW